MDAALYLETATAAATLIASPEVAARWDQPSALREMAVSGLAGHLARQITLVPDQLRERRPLPPGTEILTVLDHYARVAWIDALPEQATDAVIGLLTRLATRRHGTAAVLRALSRTERAPATIAAF